MDFVFGLCHFSLGISSTDAYSTSHFYGGVEPLDETKANDQVDIGHVVFCMH